MVVISKPGEEVWWRLGLRLGLGLRDDGGEREGRRFSFWRFSGGGFAAAAGLDVGADFGLAFGAAFCFEAVVVFAGFDAVATVTVAFFVGLAGAGFIGLFVVAALANSSSDEEEMIMSTSSSVAADRKPFAPPPTTVLLLLAPFVVVSETERDAGLDAAARGGSADCVGAASPDDRAGPGGLNCRFVAKVAPGNEGVLVGGGMFSLCFSKT